MQNGYQQPKAVFSRIKTTIDGRINAMTKTVRQAC